MSDKDFMEHIEQPVQIRLLSPLRGRRKFQGKILEVIREDNAEEADVKLACTDGEHVVPLSQHCEPLHYSDDEIRAIFRERRLQRKAQKDAEMNKLILTLTSHQV